MHLKIIIIIIIIIILKNFVMHKYVYNKRVFFKKNFIPKLISGLVSLFNDISTFMSYLMLKSLLQKASSGSIYSIAGRIREFIHFPKRI